MKYFILLAALLLAAGSVFAQEPGWPVDPPVDFDVCEGEFYHYTYWNTSHGGQIIIPADYINSNYGAAGDQIEIEGNTVIVNLDDDYYVHNYKIVRIRIHGTGAQPGVPPDDIVAEAENIGGSNPSPDEPSPLIGIDVLEASCDGSGNWVIDVIIIIGPQPNWVKLTFNVPGGPIGISEGWASQCCIRGTIPSMTTYGLGILAMLLLASGYFIIRRRRATA